MTVLVFALAVILIVLLAFFLVMWVRLVLDWVRVLQPRWRPHGVGLVVAEAAYSITDPPIKLTRRIIRPVRLGAARLDFAWSFVMLGCLVVIWLVGLVL